MDKSFIYFGDPMCSWCWGFAPVLNDIRKTFGHVAPMTFVVGGLHTGETEPMSDAYKDTIRHHWESVDAATGVVFDYSFFERDGFVLDTEPACRAAVTMRSLKPEAALEFYEAISRSFYSENKDTTALDTFKQLCPEVGVDGDEFAHAFASPEMKSATLGEFHLAQKLGVTGFPSLVAADGDDLTMLSAGYQPFDRLKPLIEDWLAGDGEADIPARRVH